MISNNMSLQLFNSLSKKKEKFIPIKKGHVKIYTCGPTVYDYVHIGNLRTFIMGDIIKRVLKFNGYKVNHVMNITDVGHLTSDADEGEDKLVLAAKKSKKTVWELSKFYTDAFIKNLKSLNIQPSNKLPRATDHIKEQISMIRKLEAGGFAYVAGGNVYFDTSRLNNYGKLGGIVKEWESRVDKDINKQNPHDFVLWFTKSKFQDQDMKWDSPWGKGYPGWHIECSAMATKYLGNHFDIHMGGEDLAHIHHNNEIAQSESALSKEPWVNYWLHSAFLVNKDNSKMSKSKGDITTLDELRKSGFHPLDYRYLTLGTHYRKQLLFSKDGLESAKNARSKLDQFVAKIRSKASKIKDGEKYLTHFSDALNDDFNTPRTLSIISKLMKDSILSNSEKYSLIIKFDEVLGLGLANISEDIPKEIFGLAEEREKLRSQKKYMESDKVREKIEKQGYTILDEIDGYRIIKSSSSN
jgi:cysteinyl-tRNA synthetase